MSKKKLSLKKEKISSLTKSDMQSIQGGKQGLNEDLAGSVGSSNHDFTCCWCTGGNGGGGGGGTITYDPNTTPQPTYTTNSPFPTR